ncbi:cleft lip and palate transmembrane protein 1-like [Pseudonaja textilis]|uniref:cleft lip and palate transmembrane protein 1-like n=1 Tax=Pseudonaja textilis TaxID=8673 RepID=UPI000EA89FE4|nr:cleft lip and palate transmembrane protein 1-like [Pseudonaja textilis]
MSQNLALSSFSSLLFSDAAEQLDRENKIAGIFPRLTFKDKSTYIESSTKIYDDMAFRYLSWILFPLLGCYAVYSLLYMEHKGWYSWILSMLYGFLLTFGFITMTPQLFINYKLKSVAHLPWRMLTYKALNTFIDDLFAFVIKMPMMYRIGCLRDGNGFSLGLALPPPCVTSALWFTSFSQGCFPYTHPSRLDFP